MKKLLGSTLALGMFFSGSAANAAELLKNLKLSGQFDMQATAASNITDFTTQVPPAGGTAIPVVATGNDRIGDAQTRLMLHIDWDMLDDVHTKVTIRKNDRNYGTAGGVNANTNANSQVVSGVGGTGVLDELYVDQALVKIDKIGGLVDATMGRQFYGTSGDIVAYYGPSDKAQYGLHTTGIDAVRADWNGDMVSLTGLVGKMTGHGVGVAGVSDVDVRGLVAMLKGNEMWNGSAYVYNAVTHGLGAVGTQPQGSTAVFGKNDFLWVVGLKGKVTAGMAWVAAEFAKNFGQDRGPSSGGHGSENMSYTGWAAKLDLGAKMELGAFGAVAPWLHAGIGSGDGSTDNKNHNFTAISPDYRPGSIYGRFAVTTGGIGLGTSANVAAQGNLASNSLSNRKIWGVGVKTTPAALNKLTAGLAFWDFNFAAETNSGTGAGAPVGNRHIGSELDLDLTWAHSENVSLMAGVGRFFPGGFINESIQNRGSGTQRGVNPANLAYFDVRVKF